MLHNAILLPDGRIRAVSADSSFGGDELQIDFPEDFDFEDLHNYRAVEGANGWNVVYDPLPEPEPGIDPLTQLKAEIREEVRAEYDPIFIELADLFTGGGA